MANRRCSIWRYAKIDDKWKYVKPTCGKNHKITPEGGTYYVRWRNGKKMGWHRCYSPVSAEQECRRHGALLTAQAYGIVAPQHPTGIPGVTSPALQTADTVPAWLEEYKLSHRPESHALMKQTIEEFGNWVVLFADIAAFYENIDLNRLASDVRRLDFDDESANLLSECLNRWVQTRGPQRNQRNRRLRNRARQSPETPAGGRTEERRTGNSCSHGGPSGCPEISSRGFHPRPARPLVPARGADGFGARSHQHLHGKVLKLLLQACCHASAARN